MDCIYSSTLDWSLDEEQTPRNVLPTVLSNQDEPSLPFRFLDLPKEIRFLCYQLLPVKITHSLSPVPSTTVAVSDKCFNPAILSTCTTVYDEAREILHNALLHDGPRLSLAYRGPNIEFLILILDYGLLRHIPLQERKIRLPKASLDRHVIQRCLEFDTQLFALRCYMRTPKDHEVHINWQPFRNDATEQEYLGDFVKDMAFLYSLVSNRPYTVSILEGDVLVPLEAFMTRRIVGYSSVFQDKLAFDGLVTWRDVMYRSSGARSTSRWLWPRERR